MSELIELELPSKETALAVFQTPKGLDPFIERIREEVTGHAVDVSTDKVRKLIASRAFKVRKMKTALDALGKEQVDHLKEIPKLIDAERKRMRESLDALADEVRKPLDEWEAAEESRIALHKHDLQGLEDQARDLDGLHSSVIAARLELVESKQIDQSWEEFETDAHRIKAQSIATLTAALATRQKYEADQLEIEKLRAEAEERRKQDERDQIARDAAAEATRKAEEKAKAERDAAAKREADAKAAQEKAERDKAEAIERQKQAEAHAEAERLSAQKRAAEAAENARLAEIKRQADEKSAAEAEQKKREANKAHQKAINNAALQAFIDNGLSEECAKLAVTLIAKNLIPAVKINY